MQEIKRMLIRLGQTCLAAKNMRLKTERQFKRPKTGKFFTVGRFFRGWEEVFACGSGMGTGILGIRKRLPGIRGRFFVFREAFPDIGKGVLYLGK